MNFHHQTKRPLCERCKRELVTPEDLPRGVPALGDGPDFDTAPISDMDLSPLDETNYRGAEKAWCWQCFHGAMGTLFLPRVRYVAMRLEDWRTMRLAVEEEKLRKWNEASALTRNSARRARQLR